MEVQLLYLILITITTTITNFACGELFLQMPLTTNPIVQEVITKHGVYRKHFFPMDPDFFSRITPVDMVTSLNRKLSHVMRHTVSGAVVLGFAARTSGLTTEQLVYNSHNKWKVNISLTEIRAVLTTAEANLYPFTDNITLTKLQDLGLRVLQHRYNISLQAHAVQLNSSNATTFKDIENDWINVVNFITASKIDRLTARHGVDVETLADALNLTSSELYHVTLNELDKILLKELKFGGEITTSSPKTTMSSTTTPTIPNNSPTPTIPNNSPTPPETLKTTQPTSRSVGSETTEKLFSTKPSLNLVSSAAGKPTEGKTEGKTEATATLNLALFVGVAVGLLLLLVASSSVWCFRRKRRHTSQNEKTKNDIKMNHLWLDKTASPIPSSPEEVNRAEHLKFVRSASTSTLGVDSRFKELRYGSSRPSSTTFTDCSTAKIPISRNSFIYDHRREIFV